MSAPSFFDALQHVLRAALNTSRLHVDQLERLTGGSSRETWGIRLTFDQQESRQLILRRDPPSLPQPDLMRQEAEVMRAAQRVGVPVPSILAHGDGDDGMGSPYLVMNHVDGETIPRRIMRGAQYASARTTFAEDCGRILAGIHQIDVASVPSMPVEETPLDRLREPLDEFLDRGMAHPALEIGMRWLEDHPPRTAEKLVVHGDFRLGNLMVGPEGIRSVLDWELSRVGDPREDLGWLCVRAWRFGGSKPVGGIGDLSALLSSYEEARGISVDRQAVYWWLLYGTIWWGVGCMRLTSRHLDRSQRSVDLAAIGRRVCENEFDTLAIIDVLAAQGGNS